MNTHADDQASANVPATLDREFTLIREAIALVASGESPRVVVSSLRFGHELLDEAQALAATRGVRVVPLWNMDESETGLAIEVIGGSNA